MKHFANILWLVLLGAGLVLSGCSQEESPVTPEDQSGQDSFPILSFDGEGDKSPVSPEDLIGTWTLAAYYPIEEKQEEFKVTFIFEENGSGQIDKAEESIEFEWSLDEWVLELNMDEDKIWDLNTIILDEYLYLFEKFESKEDKDEYSKFTKMKLFKEQE